MRMDVRASEDPSRAARRDSPTPECGASFALHRFVDARFERGSTRALANARDVSARIHLHQVADPQAAGIGDLHIRVTAIAHPDMHEVVVRAATIADRVTGKPATDRAGDRGCLAALALAHLIAEHAAGDRTDHRTGRAMAATLTDV